MRSHVDASVMVVDCTTLAKSIQLVKARSVNEQHPLHSVASEGIAQKLPTAPGADSPVAYQCYCNRDSKRSGTGDDCRVEPSCLCLNEQVIIAGLPATATTCVQLRSRAIEITYTLLYRNRRTCFSCAAARQLNSDMTHSFGKYSEAIKCAENAATAVSLILPLLTVRACAARFGRQRCCNCMSTL